MYNKHNFRTSVLLGLLIGWAFVHISPSTGRAADTPARPNIVVVLADDLGYGDLGCYGNPVIKTPHLDRFATEGVRLTACYAAAPNCSPARAGLLTGRTPYRVGVYDVIQGAANMRLREEEVTIAELLKDAGYDTYHVGKWHLTPERKKDKQEGSKAALKHGFDFSKAGGEEAGTPLLAGTTVEDFTRWVGGRKDPRRPFFAYVALTEPHAPVEKKVDEAHRKMYEGKEAEEAARKVPYSIRRKGLPWENRTAYFGCVTQMDEAFGKLMKHLDDNKLRDNTFVLFASDNGPEHRGAYAFGSPGPLRGAKGHVYEGGIREPGIVRWPGQIKPGTTCDEPINLTDVLPTLCAVAGAKVPADRVIDGVNFLPALEGKKLVRERPLYWGMWAGRGGPQYAMRDGDWKVVAFTEPLAKDRSVIEHIKSAKVVKFELYNLRKDPAEATDLSALEPAVFERMKQAFLKLHKEVLAEGPKWELEEHRNKALAAWPGQ